MVNRIHPKVQFAIAALLMALASAITATTTATVQTVFSNSSTPPVSQSDFNAFKERVYQDLSKIDLVAAQVTYLKETIGELKQRTEAR